MSYAIQCIQECVIAAGGYVNEIEILNRLKCEPDIVFEAFDELIHNGLISKEYYNSKGHKVLGRPIKNTNSFEINPEVKNDIYSRSYLITFNQIVYYEKKRFSFKCLEQIFVGNYEDAINHVRKIKRTLETSEDLQKVVVKIRKYV